MYVCICVGKEDVYKLGNDAKTKEIIKARALGIEEEQERDYQLKVTYDVGVGVGGGEVNNEYNDDYDDQVSFLFFLFFSSFFFSLLFGHKFILF